MILGVMELGLVRHWQQQAEEYYHLSLITSEHHHPPLLKLLQLVPLLTLSPPDYTGEEGGGAEEAARRCVDLQSSPASPNLAASVFLKSGCLLQHHPRGEPEHLH